MMKKDLKLIGKLFLTLTLLPVILILFCTGLNWLLSISGLGTFQQIQVSSIWMAWGIVILFTMIAVFITQCEIYNNE